MLTLETVKSILANIPKGYLSGIMLNGTLVVIVYLLLYKKFKAKFNHLRIQLKERVDGAQIKREIKNAFITLLVGAIFSSIVIYLSTKGYTKIYTNFSDNVFFSVFGFFILLFLDDTWFYWVHRLLHHPKVFKYVHVEHHKSVDVNPFTSLSFHFLEPFLLSFWIFPAAFFIPMYAPVLGFLQIWGLLDNVKSHLGYEFFPKWWNKSVLRFLTSSTYHNMHHSMFKGNYGVHFRIWDKLMGTEFANYEQNFDSIKDRKTINVEA
jgi:Delta7-sterol 5-desaturase